CLLETFMLNDICAEMCVCLVRVESCPYKLCSVDLRFSHGRCGIGVSHNKVCVAGFNLPRFVWVYFFFRFVLFSFCFRHIESLTGNLGVLSNDGFIKK
uniref:Uncharacterized protein n=1 Tax=Coturnix japonica TaxID=93934 RepID=A0A8C2U4A3_COTJA